MSQDDTEASELDGLPCSATYVLVCIVLPLLNGQIHALLFPAYTLHFDDMEWPVERAGFALSGGFVLSVLLQHVMLRTGYWLIVPLGVLHLTFASLAFAYSRSEWAVIAQIVVVFGIDPTCAIEGIAFDAFGGTESLAKQATSTALNVYSIAAALSCTSGGIVYDLAGWSGVAAYHCACQGLLLLLLCVYPACFVSFMEVFFRNDGQIAKNDKNAGERIFIEVMPAQSTKLPGVEEFQLEEVETVETVDAKNQAIEVVKGEEAHVQRSNLRPSAISNVSQRSGHSNNGSGSNTRDLRGTSRRARGSGARATVSSAGSHNRGTWFSVGGLSLFSHGSDGSAATARTAGTTNTAGTSGTARTAGTAGTVGTAGTALSLTSRTSNFTQFSDFKHTFGASNVLQPQIVGATGAKAIMRDGIDDEDPERRLWGQMGEIPKDVRFPAFLIMMNSAYNNASYVMEFATFAIYFKQYHHWDQATWAGMAQTAGDVVAAVLVPTLPLIFGCGLSDAEAERDEAEDSRCFCFRRFWHKITTIPYNVSLVLSTWILFNLAMMSPVLPISITAQVLMGTAFVCSSKFSTELNLFYCHGDPKVLLSLQVLCRNAEALGGGIGGILGTWLYTIDPLLPFVFTSALALLTWLTYTIGFCARLGFGDEIQMSERRRALRLGLSWDSERPSNTSLRKTMKDAKGSTRQSKLNARRTTRLRLPNSQVSAVSRSGHGEAVRQVVPQSSPTHVS